MAFKEPEAEQALALVEGAQLYAPTLLDYELVSIALKKSRRFPEQRDAIETGLLGAAAMQIEKHEVSYLDTLQLAIETGLSTYDASYLYLARHLGVPLVTFDKRLQQAAESL